MKTLEEIKEGLADHRLEVVAAETGLSYGTVRRYAAGIPTRPAYDTVQLLSEWLEAHTGKTKGVRAAR